VPLLSYFFLLEVRNRVLVPLMFLPSIFLTRNGYIEIPPVNKPFQKLTFTTRDGKHIDGVMWENPRQREIPTSSQKWILWLNPNAVIYEQLLEYFQKYGTHAEASVLAFNYRGVANSEGPNAGPAIELEYDAEAAMKYLLDKGVRSRNILIHGHSMGAAVGAVLRATYPDGPIVFDRSFYSIIGVALAITKSPQGVGLKATISTAIGMVLTGAISLMANSSVSQLVVNSLLSGITFGVSCVYVPGIFEIILPPILKLIGWEFNIIKKWNQIQGEKVILYHPLDGVVQQAAGLHNMLSSIPRDDKDKSRTRIIKLSFSNPKINTPDQMYHCYSLDALEHEWNHFIQTVKEALGSVHGD